MRSTACAATMLWRWRSIASLDSTASSRDRPLRVPDIQELRYAEQDAIALHTLFADNLGDGGELLIGADATGHRRALRAARHGERRRRRVVSFLGARQRNRTSSSPTTPTVRPGRQLHPRSTC